MKVRIELRRVAVVPTAKVTVLEVEVTGDGAADREEISNRRARTVKTVVDVLVPFLMGLMARPRR